MNTNTRPPRTKPAEMSGRYVNDVDPVDGDLAWKFFEACRDGEVETVRRLIADDPNLVHAQYWYTQPAHFAVYANQADVLRVLFDSGAEPGRSLGWPALMDRARQYGFGEVYELLVDVARIRFGFDPSFERVKDAIISRDRTQVDALLDAQPRLAVASDAHGSNAIHWAVMTRQPELFASLRERGANLDHQRSDGQTPGHLVFNGDYHFRVWRDLGGVPHADQGSTIKSLLDAGATMDLSIACATGDEHLVQSMLTRDPTLAARLDSGRRNPLTYAARAGHFAVVQRLMEHGARPSQPEHWAPHGWPLWMACARGDVDMVSLLLQHGADPQSAPDSSDSCLGIAKARAGTAAPDIERLLRLHGATTPIWAMTNDELREALVTRAAVTREHWFAEEVLARNELSLTDLLLEKDPQVVHRIHGGTMRLGSPDVAITAHAVLKRLLDAGFDPNRAGWLGKTALHHYAGRGETENARLVIEYGAEIDVVDDEFRSTPLGWAAAAGHLDTVQMLLLRGADISLPAEVPPARPIERARAAGHEEIVTVVRSYSSL